MPRTKPDPALYRAALAALGLRAPEALALEDSPNCIAAAKLAGLYCVAAPGVLTRHLPLEGADLELASLADLPLTRLLERIEQSSIPTAPEPCRRVQGGGDQPKMGAR